MLLGNDAGFIPPDGDGSAGGSQKSIEQLQQRGFAAAIWSQQTNDLSAFQCEIHVLECCVAAKFFRQPFGL